MRYFEKLYKLSSKALYTSIPTRGGFSGLWPLNDAFHKVLLFRFYNILNLCMHYALNELYVYELIRSYLKTELILTLESCFLHSFKYKKHPPPKRCSLILYAIDKWAYTYIVLSGSDVVLASNFKAVKIFIE